MDRERRRYSSRNHGGYSGFTLVELVVCIVIAAVLGAVAMPRMSNMLRHQQLDTASRRIMADLQLARSQAIRNKTNWGIWFVSGRNRYTDPRIDSTQFGANEIPTTQFVNFDDLYPGIDIPVFRDGSHGEIVFDRFGRPGEPIQFFISDDEEYAIIDISGATGRITRSFTDATRIPNIPVGNIPKSGLN